MHAKKLDNSTGPKGPDDAPPGTQTSQAPVSSRGASYELQALVYESSRIQVHRATQRPSGRPVIVKMLRGGTETLASIAQLKREHELLCELKGLPIVDAIAITEIDGVVALVLEDVHAISLHELLARGPLPLTTALDLFEHLATALAELHARGILHKDINPSNILVNPDTWQLRVIDLGIAARLTREQVAFSVIETLEGTLDYISPEQTGRTGHPLDERTDLYSMGATFYEMLTGAPPFAGNSPIEIVHAHLARVARPPHEVRAEVAPALSRLIMKLLEKAPESRYRSALGVAHDLREIRRRLLGPQDDSASLTTLKLAQHDIPVRLSIPHRLYGRSRERAEILHAFEHVDHGGSAMVLIVGPSGAGKTSLIMDVRATLPNAQIDFAEGKFEELRRDIPYDAIVRACRAHVLSMQSESDEAITTWRDAIVEAVAPNCQVLVDVIPELGRILGPQPATAELAPNAAKNRFIQSFVGFIHASKGSKRSLVLFLDDLQWADFASLDLLGQLVQDSSNGRVLVIGAYRAQEINDSHPLSSVLSEWRSGVIRLTEVELGPMSEGSIAELCRDALQLTLEQTLPLAGVVHGKTRGNPFFVQQFLRSLYRDGCLFFDVSTGSWSMDLGRVQTAPFTDNVVGLLAARVGALAAATREALGCAALCGATFDLNMMARILRRSLREVAHALASAVQEDLLVPVGGSYRYVDAALDECEADPQRSAAFAKTVRYRFPHDRIQEACDQLIPPDERLDLRLRIGRVLGDVHDESLTLDEQLIALHHLNAAEALIHDPAERRQLARSNLAAGQRARAATAWSIGAALFTKGIAFLDAEAWQLEPELARGLYIGAGACETLAGNFAAAEAYFAHLLQIARDGLEVAEIQLLRSSLYVAMVKNQEAIAAGLAGLKALGIQPPANPSMLSALRRVISTRFKLAKLGVDDILSLESSAKPQHELALRIFVELAHPSVLTRPLLAATLVCLEIDLILREGHTRYSAQAFLQMATTLAAVAVEVAFPIWRREEITKLHDVWRILSEKWGPVEENQRLEYTYLAACAQWYDGHPDTARQFDPLFARCVARGDVNFAMYCLLSHLDLSILIGESLPQLEQETKKRLAYVEQTKHEPFAAAWHLLHTVCQALGAETNEPAQELAARFARQAEHAYDENTTRCSHHMYQGLLCLLSGDQREALAALHRADRANIHRSFFGSFQVAVFIVLLGLALAANWPASRGLARLKLYLLMVKTRLLIRVFTAMSKGNFDHLRQLIEAEWLRARGAKPARYADHYGAAIEGARAAGYTSIEAFAAEGLGRGFLASGQTSLALGPLLTARRAYERWGIRAKVKALEALHPDVQRFATQRSTSGSATTAKLEPRTTRPASIQGIERSRTRTVETDSVVSLDAPTLIRAAQVLSGEIHLKELKRKLMRLVCENAGARRAILVWSSAKAANAATDFSVVACAQSEEELTVDVSNRALSRELMSMAALNYVIRSRTHLLVGDATEDIHWRDDLSLRARKARAVLCMPIVAAGALKGLLYLENDLTPHAFTAERVQVLTLLAGQIAISLDNAALYEQLESSLAAEKEARAKEQAAHRDYVASEKARQELVTSLEAAEAVQKSLLVVNPPLIGYELAHFYRPAERAGGDWLGCYVDELRRRAYIFLGDVTGHGISSALVTAAAAGAAASAMAQITSKDGPLTLSESLHHLALAMHEAVRRTGEPSGRIMTMALVGLDLQTGCGHYLNAGHTQIFHVGQRSVPILAGGNPLGFAAQVNLGEKSFAMQRGDRLFLFTDGLLENRKRDGKAINLRQLMRLLGSEPEPSRIVETIIPLVDDFVLDHMTDDTSFVALRWLGVA